MSPRRTVRSQSVAGSKRNVKCSLPRTSDGLVTTRAFTLIEVMVVVGIMIIVMAMSVPFVYKSLRREPLNQAVRDITDVCSSARWKAIMQGSMAEVIFHPKDRRLEVAGGARPAPPLDAKAPERNPYRVSVNGAEVTTAAETAAQSAQQSTGNPAGSGLSAQISDRVSIRGLFVNLIEYTDADDVHIRFYPNGTSDEMLIILESPTSHRLEQRGIQLEVTTGFTDILNEDDLQKLRK